MSLIWLDGFDEYPVTTDGAILENRGYLDVGEGGGNLPQISTTSGALDPGSIAAARTGSGYLWVRRNQGTGANARSCYIKKFIGCPDREVVICGFAFNTSSLGTNIGTSAIREIWSIGSDTGFQGYQVHMALHRTSINGLAIYRDAPEYFGGELVAFTKGEVFQHNTWEYIEVKWVMDSGEISENTYDGQIVVRVNNKEVINVANIRTTKDAADIQAANIIEFRNDENDNGIGNAGQAYDDLYICDGAGLKNNDFLGDIRVFTLFPNGVGDFTEFDVSGITGDNYEAVDDPSGSDEDSTFVFSNVEDEKDTYEYTNLPEDVVEVFGVQLNSRVRKEESGPTDFHGLIRLSSVETEEVDLNYPSANYETYSFIAETKPGGGDWTKTSVDATQAGIIIKKQP